ncbi:Esterase/lipase [Rhodococcus rhodochrous J45]|uniref:Esterase/lipase n=1 Tax=Rhodococcus rhodochrous J45 TaxID=935266 RepID=A0A562E2K8_RHORH|nr:Esterase/lipase [Rhodococcus rhodochrous J45]
MIALVAITALVVVGVIMTRQESTPPPGPPTAKPPTSSSESGAPSLHVDESTPLVEVMSAPEFDGFGPLLFPFYDRITDGMTVADTGMLLPYHSNIRPDEVARTLNGMLAGARDGNLDFHPIYGDEEISGDPSKAQVGLFFFRGDADAPLAIVSPGGGFSYVGSVHEGFPYAQRIAAQGYNAFVLNYRTGGGGRFATEDLAAAIDYVIANQSTLGVGTEGYSLWGSSAGARMAANLGSYGTVAFGRHDRPRPAAVIMAYTGHTSYTQRDPATFAVVGSNDGIASPSVMEERVRRLERAGIDAKLQRYHGIGHGFGLGTGTVAEGWVDDALAFWTEQLDAG